MKTQIEIDCTASLNALGYEVIESSLDYMYRKIVFKTNKPVGERAAARIQQRVSIQQKETYTVHFTTVEANKNQEPKEKK